MKIGTIKTKYSL